MSSALACAGLAFSGEAEFSWLLKNAYQNVRETGAAVRSAGFEADL